MAKGKRTCKILKEIRRQIAAANDIELVVEECRYKGDCSGTCPRCEAEVRYLEEQLQARRLSGRAVALSGISAGMLLMAGCTAKSTAPVQTQQELSIEEVPLTDECQSRNVVAESDEDFLEGEECDEEDITDEDGEIDEWELTTIMQGDPSFKDWESEAYPIDPLDLSPEERVFQAVGDAPAFPGGDTALMQYLKENIVYPEQAAIQGIEGCVVVKFRLASDGSIADVVVVESAHELLDAEAVRVVKTIPNFIVPDYPKADEEIWLTLPINFRIPDSD